MVNLFLCHVTLMMHKALCNLKISDMNFFLSGTKCLILITDAVERLYLQTVALTSCLI